MSCAPCARPLTWLLWSTVGFGLFYAPLTWAGQAGAGRLAASTWRLVIVAAPALSGWAGLALIVLGLGAHALGQIPGGGDHQQQDDGAEGERLEGEPGDAPDRPEVVRDAEELLQGAGEKRHP
ncbi:hypothetical protein GTY76_03520 [Streptomyces sp. SID4951]|nr:hypothetical protein [Streptomyces sp. SID4951]